MRTNASNGIILSVHNESALAADFLTMGLMDGYPFVSFEYGAAPLFVEAPHFIADGVWHALSVTRSSGSGTLMADGREYKASYSSVVDAANDGSSGGGEGPSQQEQGEEAWQALFSAALPGRMMPSRVIQSINGSAVTLGQCAQECLDLPSCVAFSFSPSYVMASNNPSNPVSIAPAVCELNAGGTTEDLLSDPAYVYYTLAGTTLASDIWLQVGSASFAGCIGGVVIQNWPVTLANAVPCT